MINKPIGSIAEADLRALIDARTPESRQLEYKQELPDSGDRGNVKFLREVTAFANSQGGDLLYGMAEADGIAHELHPLTMASQDLVRQRLESLCTDGVEPRLTGLVQYQFVPLAGGGDALVVRIAKSWSAPHRVTTGGHAHFYGRNASGCYPLDVDELRQSFTLSQTLTERIRAFRADRLLKIGSGDTPVHLARGARVVLHLVPIQSMTTGVQVEIRGNSQTLLRISPPGTRGWDQRFNLDGRLTFSSNGDEGAVAYAQLFRNGIIESVTTYRAHGCQPDTIIPSVAYEQDTLRALSEYLKAVQELGLSPPLYVFLACVGVAGYRLGVDTWRSGIDGPRYADRNSLVIPEILIEEWPADINAVMQPAFDAVWNGFGYERSFNYDQHGHWNPR